MFKLKLDPPSSKLLAALTDDMQETLPNYVPGYEYLSPGIADSIYLRDKVALVGKQELQHLFDEEIFVVGMIIRPCPWTNTNYVISQYPVHTDVQRTLGLNYLIDTGGKKVTTTIYEYIDEGPRPLVVSSDQVKPIKSCVFTQNNWYGVDSVTYHSVDNLEHDRIMISISFTDLTYDRFLEKYQHLIESVF